MPKAQRRAWCHQNNADLPKMRGLVLQDTEACSIESAACFGDTNNETTYLLLLSKASSSHVEKLLSTSLVLVLRALSQLPKSKKNPEWDCNQHQPVKSYTGANLTLESLKIISENVTLIPSSSSELKHKQMETFLFPAEFHQ